MTGTSGPTSRTPFAFYDLGSSCWRTYAVTLDGDSTLSSPTLPASGSMRAGRLYEHPTSAPHTAVSGCSSSPLLPTPRTTDTNGAGTHGTGGPDLRTAVSLLPTPAARDWKSGQSNIMDRNARPLNEVAVNWLFPTPRATDGTKGGPSQRGSSGDLMLPSAVQRLLPTPRASDTGTPGRRAGEGFRPPLSQVLLSSGEPTSLPSDGGITSPDASRPVQLSLDVPGIA
jgi:hypothetical protein